MRAARPVATALLGLGLLAAVSGCGAVQQAADTANQVGNAATKLQVCGEALKAVTFSPDTTDPQKALEAAQQKGKELADLAAKAGDTTLKQAIDGVAKSMNEVTLQDLSAQSVQDWLQKKADLAAKVTQACAG
ncbi:hypothetical protein JOF53_006764 [Crossiella equi]|uniref:Uncharacterized protein n=1 Tax=Crossiella equi TaxID=130796 RepID=A0ABS5AMT7_9PSEU|nr:bacteriophage spanin2 family protein [Crossiella equi]MBP2477892.1 hypothetical protein [Crossiella equi]